MLISKEATNKLKNSISKSNISYCDGLFNSARWFILKDIIKDNINLIVLPDKESAEYCAADLYNIFDGDIIFFLPTSGKNNERSNYKSTLEVQRTATIGKIIENKGELLIIVSYPEALEENIPQIEDIKNSLLTIELGNNISYDFIKESLFNNNFEKVDFVSNPGQFAIRGGIIDIFSYSDNNPYRISFFGDEIESINIFDTNTQLSKGKLDKVDIYSDFLSDRFIIDRSFASILSKDALIWLDSSDVYNTSSFYDEFEEFKRVFLDVPLSYKGNNIVKFNIKNQPTFNKNFDLLTEDIRIKYDKGYKVIIYGNNKAQIERLKSILYENGGVLPEFEIGKKIHKGFIDEDDKICYYSEYEIFNKFYRVNLRRTVDKSEQLTINDLNSFNIGDYIVHIDHGVGIFGGLVKMKDDMGRRREVIKLMYKDKDVLFISVHSLHKISLYRSKDSEPPKIYKLGSKTWQTLKTKTKSKVKDIAKDLIKLYAERKSVKAFAFSPDTYLQDELESSFIYEDTPDQEKAIKAIKLDMEDDCPMDRLVCGDVGFGKTEVAIRAAFKAVADSKQVVVLVPTTILALQHYNTFKNRLNNFPCNIDYVSRLRTTKEINSIREDLSIGRIDIVIGTHKILGKGFDFKDLGLLIIDEEQKFGVGAKEKLRTLKQSVDTLTLTATPIPRTLQFSLLGARDLSIINTPPPNRIPIQTEIILFNDEEIKNIINYELNRGGQVFFVHNRVDELDAIKHILQRLNSDMKICVAHGQMEPKVLENIILDFMAGDFDLLLCTTIVENGLDIPNANTIIINQAQNIGLSDLHQLRGRVGRSNKRAFCYLIVPPLVSITDEARRRLKAIESFSDLGSGFNIAMQDLDIRGAGNLLGGEQSGFISDIGFETYQKILAEAMEELGLETGIVKTKTNNDFIIDCTIETDQVALIPDSYIDITSEKIRIYKELDLISDEKSLKLIETKLIDRFGKFPEEIINLFNIVKIRQLGESCGLEKIIIKNNILIAFFVSNPLSNYYKSQKFIDVINNINSNNKLFELNQNNDNKLRLISRNIGTLEKAYQILLKLTT